MGASARQIEAGRAYVSLGVNNTGLQKGLDAAQKRVAAWGSAITGMGAKLLGVEAVIKGALFGAAKSWAEQGSALLGAATRTGMTVEAFSELAHVLNQTDVDVDDFEKSFGHMQRRLVEAANGSAEAQRTFALLGINIREFSTLSGEKQFSLLADAFSKIENPATASALAVQLFGKSGRALLPTLDRASSGIAALSQEARDLGVTWSTADATAARDFGNTLKILTEVLKRTVAVIGGAAAPAIRPLIKLFTTGAQAVRNFIQQNQGLVATLFTAAGVIGAVGVGLMILGPIISGVGVLFGVVSSAIAVGSTVISAAMGLVSFALSGPIGILAALAASALVAAGVIAVQSGLAGDAVASLGQSFGGLLDDAMQSWSAISAAMASGDLGAAARVAWLQIRAWFLQGVGWVQDIWFGFRNFWADVWAGAQTIVVDAVFGIARFWNDLVTSLRSAWNDFTRFFVDSWTVITSEVEGAWVHMKRILGLMTEDEANAALQQITAARDAQVNANQQITQQQQQGIDAQHAQVAARINEANQAATDMTGEESAARQRQRQQALEGIAAEIRSAQEELSTARGAALASSTRGASGATPERRFPELDPKSFNVAGSFNAAAARGLASGGSAAERTADATEQTARGIDRLIEAVRSGRITAAEAMEFG